MESNIGTFFKSTSDSILSNSDGIRWNVKEHLKENQNFSPLFFIFREMKNTTILLAIFLVIAFVSISTVEGISQKECLDACDDGSYCI